MCRSSVVGTAACTASVRSPSTSPPVGPTDVAPTNTPRSESSTSLMNPRFPALWIHPRVDSGIWTRPTRTSMPCRRAASSFSPTEPISGSVKVTRGTAR